MGQETKTKEDIRITELKNSPIYAMSLGSKELFHSNLWAWLMEQNKEFAKVFFPEIDVNSIKKDGIKREENNRDITIHTEKGCYVIENKIKSLPTSEQLENYRTKTKNFQKGLLTGMQLEMPKYINSEGWGFLSYSEIAKGIRTRFDLLNDEKYRIVAEMYCDDLDRLYGVISNKLASKSSDLWIFEDEKDFKDIRFGDVYKKLKCDELNLKLIKELEKKGYKDGDPAKRNKNFTFKIEKNFSNSAPLISFKYIYNYKDSVTGVCAIGVQIQRDAFCRFAEPNKKWDCNMYFEEFKNIGWFGYFDKGKGLLKCYPNNDKGLKTNMRPQKPDEKAKKQGKIGETGEQYNHFDYFIYQHFNIKGKSVEFIANLLDEHLKYAETKLKDAEKVFKELENK